MTEKVNAVASYARILVNLAPEIRAKVEQAMQTWGIQNGLPLHEIPEVMAEVDRVDLEIDRLIARRNTP